MGKKVTPKWLLFSTFSISASLAHNFWPCDGSGLKTLALPGASLRLLSFGSPWGEYGTLAESGLLREVK